MTSLIDSTSTLDPSTAPVDTDAAVETVRRRLGVTGAGESSLRASAPSSPPGPRYSYPCCGHARMESDIEIVATPGDLFCPSCLDARATHRRPVNDRGSHVPSYLPTP